MHVSKYAASGKTVREEDKNKRIKHSAGETGKSRGYPAERANEILKEYLKHSTQRYP